MSDLLVGEVLQPLGPSRIGKMMADEFIDLLLKRPASAGRRRSLQPPYDPYPKAHRGEGMLLLAMNWRGGPSPDNFAGFAIEYCEPNSTQFYPLKNRLSFEGNAGSMSSEKRPPTFSTLIAPIQKFRWVHFPRNAELQGDSSTA
ncbi:hypothetical protein [Rhizobium leguminosarum]|uniref:hypothetical protein n=1 Tax=Rhizobium leguminosarum TaxID=384 RepID=UPI0028B09FAA|nr:hypothetical protein [Rhizobium leguminosarum]